MPYDRSFADIRNLFIDNKNNLIISVFNRAIEVRDLSGELRHVIQVPESIQQVTYNKHIYYETKKSGIQKLVLPDLKIDDAACEGSRLNIISVHGAWFTADDAIQRIFCATYEGITIRNTEDLSDVYKIDGKPSCFTYSYNNHWLIYYKDKKIEVMDALTQKILRSWPLESHADLQLAFDDRTDTLIALTTKSKEECLVSLWDAKNDVLLHHFTAAYPNNYWFCSTQFFYLKHCKLLVMGTLSGSIFIWDLLENRWAKIINLTTNAGITQISFDEGLNKLIVTQNKFKFTQRVTESETYCWEIELC